MCSCWGGVVGIPKGSYSSGCAALLILGQWAHPLMVVFGLVYVPWLLQFAQLTLLERAILICTCKSPKQRQTVGCAWCPVPAPKYQGGWLPRAVGAGDPRIVMVAAGCEGAQYMSVHEMNMLSACHHGLCSIYALEQLNCRCSRFVH